MRTNRILLTLAVVLLGITSAGAADLSRIDRTLPDEPTYRTDAPKYCLLAFGPEARTRVWLVQDDQVMHVHHSADGKSSEGWRRVNAVDRIFALGDVWEAEGKTRHTHLRYAPHHGAQSMTVLIDGKDQQVAGCDRAGKLAFAARAKDAPVIHFNGPLTMDLYRIQVPLRSRPVVRLSAVVGTPGSGPGTFAHLYCEAFTHGPPTADVEYPPREPGGKPIVVRIRLEGD